MNYIINMDQPLVIKKKIELGHKPIEFYQYPKLDFNQMAIQTIGLKRESKVDNSKGKVIPNSNKMQLGYKPKNNISYNFQSYIPKILVVDSNKQHKDNQNTVSNNSHMPINKIYKGLNKQTKGKYYDVNGNILFTNGKLTQIGQQLFGKNANRAQWNMQNGNIFQNNSWRADTSTFDFKNMKALKGYENKYINSNGQWMFKDNQSGKWTYFNPIISKSNNQKQNNEQDKPIQNSVDKNGFVLASSLISRNNHNTWDLLQGKNISKFIIDGWGRNITSEGALKNKYVAEYLDKYNGRNPIDGTPIKAIRDQADKDFDLFMKHYFVKNPSINKNTWYVDSSFTPKYVYKGRNLAIVNSSDGKLPIIQNINGTPYLMDENGHNTTPMIDTATGNQNFYMQETKDPNAVLYNNKHYNVYVPATEYKQGGQIINKMSKKVNKKYLGGILNNKFNNWINANN